MSRAEPTRHLSSRRRRREIFTLVAAIAVLLTGWPSAATAGLTTTQAVAAIVAPSNGVFAIDDDHHTVVFIPSYGGTPRPVTSGLTSPTQIVASKGGSVFIIDGTRLLKVTPQGAVRTIRTGLAPFSRMAVDDNNWLFVLDGRSIVKYSPRDGSAPVAVGTSPAYNYAYLTVDSGGNVSLTGPNPVNYQQNYTETMITTYPIRGGKPTARTLISDYTPTNTYFNGPSGVVEARDGTIYLETSESGGSGATDVYRVPTGPPGLTKTYQAMPRYSEYAFNVDSASIFYLLQNRLWCAAPTRDDGSCVDDYGVDVVQQYASSGSGRVDTAVTGVDLPVGGISVGYTGAIYAAVLVSRSAGPTNNTAVPRMLRIDPTGGPAVVLARGHFSMPVAEDFLWFA